MICMHTDLVRNSSFKCLSVVIIENRAEVLYLDDNPNNLLVNDLIKCSVRSFLIVRVYLKYLHDLTSQMTIIRTYIIHVKVAVLQNTLKIISYKFFKVFFFQIYIIVVSKKTK